MANISSNWNRDMPSGTSLVSQGDDLMRQHWGSLEDTLEEEHYFADSPTSAGIHKAGASRISYGNLTSLKTTPEEGRAFYAVDDQSMHITGPSATTKISGSQQGGPVRSSVSETFGWYISSYTTTNKLSSATYNYLNATANPMTYRSGSERILGLSVATTGPSAATVVAQIMPWSVTSRGFKAHTWRLTSLGGSPVAPTDAIADRYIVHVATMGLIPLSEMS